MPCKGAKSTRPSKGLTLPRRRYVVAPSRRWNPPLDFPPLAADFPTPSREAWTALVEKTLKGGSPESLTTFDYDGLPTQALYTHAVAQPDAVRLDVLRTQGEGRWDVRTVVAHPDPATAHQQALQDLENGANSLLLRLDPTGADGVAVATPDDLARVLAGVELELAAVALDAGFAGVAAAEHLHAVARSAPRARLALHLDPLSAFARAGSSPGPIDAHVAAAAEVAARLRQTYPEATVFLASGAVVHEAGGAEVQELAVLMAAVLAYVRAADAAGVAPDESLPLIALGVAADADYFVVLAKLRAVRALWSRMCAAFGVAHPARVEARSSRRMLSRLDPWVNLLRLAAAGFAAATGGAEAVVLEPFTQPLGRPTDFARRQARNAQLVLMEEASLARVADPAGGAWFLDARTDQLARAAWACLQQIERHGGLARALEGGLIQGWVSRAREAFAADLTSGARKLVGVNVHRTLDAPPLATDSVDASLFAKPAPEVGRPGADSACAALVPWRASEAFEAGVGQEPAS